MDVKEFQGIYRFLSNFWIIDIMYNNKIYPSVEHAYQAAKTFDTFMQEKIRKATTPGQAKKFGRYAKLKPGWDNARIDVMRNLLIKKFRDFHLKRFLIATYPSKLEEGNRWGDTFWGIDLLTGEGQNNLGKLIMQVRQMCIDGTIE